jgi:hypothetical protein
MTAIADNPATSAQTPSPISRRAQITGRIVTGLVSALLFVDAVSHLALPDEVKDASYELGFTDGDIVAMGVVMLGCLALYLYPRTAILGAVILTGYFGGAVTSQMIAEESFSGAILMPLAVGIAVWAGLWLRSASVRSIMPLTR